MAPAALWLLVFLVLPFIAILVFAFGERAPEGGYQAAFTLDNIANLPLARGGVHEHADCWRRWARSCACSSPIPSPTTSR